MDSCSPCSSQGQALAVARDELRGNGILEYEVRETGVFALNGGSRPVEASTKSEEKKGVPL